MFIDPLDENSDAGLQKRLQGQEPLTLLMVDFPEPGACATISAWCPMRYVQVFIDGYATIPAYGYEINSRHAALLVLALLRYVEPFRTVYGLWLRLRNWVAGF